MAERGDALSEFAQWRAPLAGARADERAQPEHGLGARVRTVGDEPARRSGSVDELEAAIACERVAPQRAEGEIHPLAQERGELRFRARERAVALAQGPDRPGQPVRVRGVG